MCLMRLTYFSTLDIDQEKHSTLSQLVDILDAARRNNSKKEITGALIFDAQYFVQILEGERDSVWQTFKRIEKDSRHSNVTLVEMALASGRCFGNWWMSYAERNLANSRQFAPFLVDNVFDPSKMLPEQILSLMINLTYLSPEIELKLSGEDIKSRYILKQPNPGRALEASS